MKRRLWHITDMTSTPDTGGDLRALTQCSSRADPTWMRVVKSWAACKRDSSPEFPP